jgi:hypothetical protein
MVAFTKGGHINIKIMTKFETTFKEIKDYGKGTPYLQSFLT